MVYIYVNHSTFFLKTYTMYCISDCCVMPSQCHRHIIFCSGVQYRTKVIPMSLINCSCCPQIHISSRKKDNSSFVNVHTPTFSHMPRERGRRKVEINEPSGIAFQSMVSPYTGKLISVIVKTQQLSLSLSLSLCIFLYLALVFT